MSTKDKVHSMVDSLNEEQIRALFVILDGMIHEEKPKAKKTAASIRGILHDVANPDLIPFEKDAWAEAAVEKHIRFLEEEKNDNS
ncbi:MAG: hypothetical protein J1E40_07275 [Oscillospiraceae bacterium]|nr:hypothetical protein [Oscillospiraceae bacterium]